jgi:HEAT repeats
VALREFLVRVHHPDPGVRETVAFQLPFVLDPRGVGGEVADAFVTLAEHSDADVRYYALFAVVEEGAQVGAVRRERILELLRDDPDERVRELACAGAIVEPAEGFPAVPGQEVR